ncbi:MAG: Phosphoribosylformylglycinamidine synthase, PurS subunit, partial [uncultured Gemmatimonadetes bacterium]
DGVPDRSARDPPPRHPGPAGQRRVRRAGRPGLPRRARGARGAADRLPARRRGRGRGAGAEPGHVPPAPGQPGDGRLQRAGGGGQRERPV